MTIGQRPPPSDGARGRILARIRARQGKAAAPAAAERDAVNAHIAAHPQNARPRVDWDPAARFREQAERLASTVDQVETLDAVPAAVARYLRHGGLPLTAVCWDEFADLAWSGAGIDVLLREARDADLVGVTGAFCAIAETGTLMTVSGPRTPATANLLPETHIAIVRASRVVRGMEEAWQLLRDELKVPPRAVNFISGPSRSADIEQTVTLGAHGPYRVHIVLVRDRPAA
ncbi:MAG TPA: lactate utilization protein C [Burkholderiales bacterium]|nr:lactate utilization protein C [Burkholderiales bacterium]